MNLCRYFLITVLILLQTGCASYDFSQRVVQQGNLLPQSKIKRLNIGMSKQDVVILMGTSVLNTTFSQSRWDYAYTFCQGNSAQELRHLVLYFNREKLIKILYNA